MRHSVALAVCLFAGVAYGGTLRYDLPELLGEQRFDGTRQFGNSAQVDTPFSLYAVEQARLVIEGSVSPGKAHGDGVIRLPLDFDLMPFVQAGASFQRSLLFPATPTVGPFSFDEIYPFPFVPETTPLPNPGGYPPILLTVGLGISLSFTTNFPPKIDPASPFYDAMDGVIVDVPIVANVTTAYIELSGASIVPEPPTASLALASCFCILLCCPRNAFCFLRRSCRCN